MSSNQFEVGDKVVMDRSSDMFKDITASNYRWWGELEEQEPLEVIAVEDYDVGRLSILRFEGVDYEVSTSWVKPYREEE